ncbi:MAG TPA: DUF4290 domain-containing protein [Chitinophagaceae bacterium]|nr:DUF4290 domain-containing protein [Chitinophagaceae bacterium]
MQYNTTRPLMTVREYGRSVHDMVSYLLTIEDRDVRQRNAEAVIEIMAMLNPQANAMEDYKHKLWDHLFLMSNYKLDVDSPYPIPTEEIKQRKPDPIPYPKNKIRWNHFGKSFEKLFEKAMNEQDEELKQGHIQVLALFMKVAYSNWHKENVHDDMIRDELANMSKGQLIYDPGVRFRDVVDSSDLPTIRPVNPEGLSKRMFERSMRNNRNNVNGINPNRNNKFKKFRKKNNPNNS